MALPSVRRMNCELDVPATTGLSVFEALETRRAIKHFDPAFALDDATLRRLLTAAALAPTAFNIQDRHVVVVRDPAQKARLQHAAFGQPQVAQAAAVFVLCGDHGAHRRTDRYLRHAPAAARAAMEPMIAAAFDGDVAKQREEGVRSTAMMAMALMLAATELGLDSGPMTGFDPAQVSALLGLDEAHPPAMLVVVGRGARVAHPRLGLLDLDEFVSLERFGEHTLRGALEVL